VISHPDYERKNFEVSNDIAIVKLTTRIEIDDFVTPICLPEKADSNVSLDSVDLFHICSPHFYKLIQAQINALVPINMYSFH
jgi:hypothetical protein